MPKERSINPVQAQRKAEKQKEINKSRKLQQAQRNEKLARRNPERLQRQIDEYKELEERGVLCSKDRETLAQLEKDLRSIKRAREALGDVAPKFGREEKRDGRQEQKERRQKHQHQQSLGKRRRDEEVAHSADTDPKVHMIPMPRDTPPPFPYEHFAASRMQTHEKRELHALPAKPVVPAQTVYSAAPQLRDLKKEALKFMPSVVSQKRSRIKGEGRLLEPEELDGLERSGYTAGHNASITMGQKVDQEQEATAGKVETGDIDLEEEAKKFEEEIKDTYILQMQSARDNKADPRSVQVEEVKDEGD